ncbi:DUF2135 domain-containing protein, partial [Microscilla marina]
KRSSGDVNRVRLEIGDKETLPLHSRQIAVKVEGFRARVVMDCYFYNHHNRRFEGTFKLKLPNGASPSFFAFGETKKVFEKARDAKVTTIDYAQNKQWNFHGDSLLVNRTGEWSAVKRARVVPKQKAAYAYTQTVYNQVDPALMEWSGADMFNCRVYPLTAKKMHHIVIAYDIDLLETDENYVLQLALGNAPPKKAKTATKKKPSTKNQSNLVKTPSLKVNLAIAQANTQTLNILPAVQPQQLGNNVHLHWVNPEEREVKVTIPKQSQLVLKSVGGQAINYFATSFKANLPKIPRKNMKKNVVFLLDVSLSSQPDKFNVWLTTLRTLLHENRDVIKRFSVIFFNVEAFWWRKGWTKNSPGNIASFMKFANKLSLEGATDLGRALDEVYNSKLKSKAKYLFLLSDGDLSWGENGLYQLSKKIASQDELYAFSTGLSGTDARILDHLARSTQGAVFSILNESEVYEVSQNFRFQPWRINQVTMPGSSDFLLAGRPQYLYPGQKIVLAGRYAQNMANTLFIDLTQPAHVHTLKVNFSQRVASALAPRVYGQIATTQLEDLGSLGEKDAIKYATHFEVPGQTCSFVMLESDRDYKRYNIQPEDNLKFVQQNLVNKLLPGLLKNLASLGNPKVDFINLVKKLSGLDKSHSGSELKLSKTLDSLIKSLPVDDFIVHSPRLNGRRRTKSGMLDELLATLQDDSPDYKIINRAADRRRNKGDAMRLLSSLVEKNAGDPNQLRDVGFSAMKWGLTAHTYFIFKKLIDLRPYQPPSYQLIAQALVQMGKYELAMLYYELAVETEWDDWESHDFKTIVAMDYLRLLRKLKQKRGFKLHKYVAQRLLELEELIHDEDYSFKTKDLMVYITWNTDQTYVDLYVKEPSKEVCSYKNDETNNGGMMTEDVEGLGPVLYYADKTQKGKYEIRVNYYNQQQERASTKTRVYIVVYRNWGRRNEKVTHKVITLDSKNANTVEAEDKMVRIGKIRF